MGQTTLVALNAVTFIPHFKIKFPTPHVVKEVKGDLNIARKYYWHTLTSSIVGVSKQKQTIVIEIEPFTDGATKLLAMSVEEVEDVELIPGNMEKGD